MVVRKFFGKSCLTSGDAWQTCDNVFLGVFLTSASRMEGVSLQKPPVLISRVTLHLTQPRGQIDQICDVGNYSIGCLMRVNVIPTLIM